MAPAVPAVESVPGVRATATLVLRPPTTGVFVSASALEGVDRGAGEVPSAVVVVGGLAAPVVCATVVPAELDVCVVVDTVAIVCGAVPWQMHTERWCKWTML